MALPYVEYEKNIIDEGLETGMKKPDSREN